MDSSKDLSMDQAFLHSLKEIVLFNLENEQFGAEDISYAIGLSRSQVHRKLQKINGKSITQFIRETRLDVAFDLLHKEVGTASEISYRVGFSSPAYFTKCFHDYFGFPPGEIKKKKDNNPSISQNQPNPEKSTWSKVRYRIHESSRSEKWRFMIYAIMLTMLVLSIYYFFDQQFMRSGSSPFAAGKTMAVILFDNESSDPESEYFYAGMLEDILAKLQNISALNVLSRMSTERYRNSTLDPIVIARELKVEYLLRLSTIKWESNFRVSAEMIDGNTGFPVWTESYEEEMRNIFTVQADIALNVSRSLEITLSDDEEEQITSLSAVSVTAYDYLLQGRYKQSSFWFGGDTSALRDAEILYDKVLKLDPGYAQAWMRKGSVYYDRYVNSAEYFESDFLDSTLYFCDKAIALNSKYGHAYMLKGLAFHKKGNIELAIEHYEQAFDLIRNNDEARHGTLFRLGFIYIFKKDYLKGLQLFRKSVTLARTLRIFYPASLHSLGQAYMYAGAYDKGKEYLGYSQELGVKCECTCYFDMFQGNFTSSIECLPTHCQTDTLNISCNELLANGYFQLREYDKSLKYFRRYRDGLEEMGRIQFDNLYREGIALIELGNKKEGRRLVEQDFAQLERRRELERSDEHDYHLAAIHAYQGEKEKALSSLRDYDNQVFLSHSYIILISFAEHDILFEQLWDNPQFKAMIKQDKERKALARARILEMEEQEQHVPNKSANP